MPMPATLHVGWAVKMWPPALPWAPALRARFPDENLIIEDYIDFHVLLPRVSVFVCNGGYGSVLLALANGVPLVAAGKLEGKCDINARIDWSGVGVDLRTERPTAKQIAAGVARVLADPRHRENAARIQRELASYSAFEIIERRMFQTVAQRDAS